MKLQQLNEKIYICDQITTDDISTLKKEGISTIVNNRPDNEGINQPLSESIKEQATKAELEYYYLPVISGNYLNSSIKKLIKILNTATKPIVLFCRTGNRSFNLWAVSQVEKYGHEYILTKAKGIGFEVTSLAQERNEYDQ